MKLWTLSHSYKPLPGKAPLKESGNLTYSIKDSNTDRLRGSSFKQTSYQEAFHLSCDQNTIYLPPATGPGMIQRSFLGKWPGKCPMILQERPSADTSVARRIWDNLLCSWHPLGFTSLVHPRPQPSLTESWQPGGITNGTRHPGLIHPGSQTLCLTYNSSTGLKLRCSNQGTDEKDMLKWCNPIARDKEQATRDFSRANPLDVALSQAEQ